METYGEFIIQTLVETDQVVDQATVTDPFSITAGNLYVASMTFDPSINSSPNPSVILSFMNQHQLVSGSSIEVIIPSHNNELALFS
jgi:hypothetical protein